MSVVCQIRNYVWPTRMLKVFFTAVKPVTPRVIHFLYARALAWTKKKLKLAQ